MVRRLAGLQTSYRPEGTALLERAMDLLAAAPSSLLVTGGGTF